VVDVSPNNELAAQFTFEQRIYSIEGNLIPEKILKEERKALFSLFGYKIILACWAWGTTEKRIKGS
jgi:hypothetical protein